MRGLGTDYELLSTLRVDTSKPRVRLFPTVYVSAFYRPTRAASIYTRIAFRLD